MTHGPVQLVFSHIVPLASMFSVQHCDFPPLSLEQPVPPQVLPHDEAQQKPSRGDRTPIHLPVVVSVVVLVVLVPSSSTPLGEGVVACSVGALVSVSVDIVDVAEAYW